MHRNAIFAIFTGYKQLINKLFYFNCTTMKLPKIPKYKVHGSKTPLLDTFNLIQQIPASNIPDAINTPLPSEIPGNATQSATPTPPQSPNSPSIDPALLNHPHVHYPKPKAPKEPKKRGRPPKDPLDTIRDKYTRKTIGAGLPPTRDRIAATKKRQYDDSVSAVLQPISNADYKEVYADHALRVLMLGHTRIELAKYFGVEPRVLDQWAVQNETFAKVLRVGIANSLVPVVHGLHKRATGFTQETPGEYILDGDGNYKLDKDGNPRRRLIVQYFPPDTAACQTILKAHYKAVWGQEVKEAPGGVNGVLALEARKKLEDIFNAPPDKAPERT